MCWKSASAQASCSQKWRGAAANVTGVDLSAAMQRVTSSKVKNLAASPRRIHGRVQALPLRDACCDTVVSTFPTPYIVEVESLGEIARVLRPGGGRLVVVGLTVYTERHKEEIPLYLRVPTEPGVDAFCHRAEAAGLRVRRIYAFHPTGATARVTRRAP